MKARPDSLYARLTPTQREELLVFLVEQGGSYQDGIGVCGDWGINASPAALSRFVSHHGLPWRIARAQAAAQISEASLPKDWEGLKRRGMAQKEFELSFRDLSVKEYALLRTLELDAKRLELKANYDTKRLELAERRIVLLEAQAEKAKSTLEDSGLTDSQRVQRMKQVFGLA